MSADLDTAPAAVDPDFCPGGGCLLGEGRVGTCAAMQGGRQNWKFCIGMAAVVCPEAMARWRAAGCPELTREQLDAIRTGAPVPRFTPPRAYVAPEVASAPADLGAWDTWAPDTVNGRGITHAEAQHRVRAFASTFAGLWAEGRARGNVPSLLLLGPEGTGKTYLTRILGRQAADAGWDVRFTVWLELVERVKATRGADNPHRLRDVLEPYIAADLLILDDVRPAYDSQDDENIAHTLVAERDQRDRGGAERPTFLTANLTLPELRTVIGPPAVDRLLAQGRRHLACGWPSWRARRD